jgi:hypothetical protein
MGMAPNRIAAIALMALLLARPMPKAFAGA